MSSKPGKISKVLSGTGGAVPVRNEKGEIYMQKVKVERYVAGKRPKYATESDDEMQDEGSDHDNRDESEASDEVRVRSSVKLANLPLKTDVNDRRLKRLMEAEKSGMVGEASEEARRRHVAEPEVLDEGDDMEIETSDDDDNDERDESSGARQAGAAAESDEEEIDEEERMRRRAELRKRALQRQEELMAREEEAKASGRRAGAGADDAGSDDESGDDDDDESEYEDEEEYSDEGDEMAMPRLKPVFIRKSDRVTIKEKEMEEERERQIEAERERLHQENVKHTHKIIQDEITREKLAEKETDDKIACDFKTDDEEEENEKEYEEWKLRELKRIKRDREAKENMNKEKEEIQKVRNMTEEEREVYFKQNPKFIANQSEKGKYKFLQKYYHRGAFFMDEDQSVFKRNFAEPTLEDNFDKSILPKVMQVKNFGMAGRTKYTHLLDQDTSAKVNEENPWAGQEKYILAGRGGGTKQVFDKPTAKKRK